MRTKSVFAAALAGPALALFASSVAAQSGPPIGFWATADGNEQMLITQNAQCSLADRYGRPFTSGPCSWQPSSRGGILTIMSQQTYRPAPIYFSVVWVDANTVTVDGDVFHRKGS